MFDRTPIFENASNRLERLPVNCTPVQSGMFWRTVATNQWMYLELRCKPVRLALRLHNEPLPRTSGVIWPWVSCDKRCIEPGYCNRVRQMLDVIISAKVQLVCDEPNRPVLCTMFFVAVTFYNNAPVPEEIIPVSRMCEHWLSVTFPFCVSHRLGSVVFFSGCFCTFCWEAFLFFSTANCLRSSCSYDATTRRRSS